MFTCEMCQTKFSMKHNLSRHINSVHTEKRDHKCHLCSKSFSRLDVLKNHIKTHDSNTTCSNTENDSATSQHNEQLIDSNHGEDYQDDCITETSINSLLVKKTFQLSGAVSDDLLPALKEYKVEKQQNIYHESTFLNYF